MLPLNRFNQVTRSQFFCVALIPAVLVSLFAFVSEYDMSLYRRIFDGEQGIVENLQVIFLLVAIFFCFKFLRQAGQVAHRLVKSYCWVFLAALVFVTGEEISWGQVYFEWHTPEWYASVNKQGETNLHNSSSWLNFKPRIVVQFMIIIFGVAGPLLLSRLSRLSGWKRAIMPDMLSFYVAVLCLVLKLLSEIGSAVNIDVVGFRNMRFSEMQELLFYFFFLS